MSLIEKMYLGFVMQRKPSIPVLFGEYTGQFTRQEANLLLQWKFHHIHYDPCAQKCAPIFISHHF